MIGNIFKSVIFGIIEGITEWLPISSTVYILKIFGLLKLKKKSMEVVVNLNVIKVFLIYGLKSL